MADKNDLKTLSPEVLLHLAKTLNIPLHSVVATIALLDEGGTVPFIARYRKEVTGALDEVADPRDRRQAGVLPRACGEA